MTSKRMSISALLSNDTSPSRSNQSSPAPNPTPTPAPTTILENEGRPHKRQRHTHTTYTQQYYESYNAYPYVPSASRNVAPNANNPTTFFTSSARASPPPWSPLNEQQREQWGDSRLYVPATASFDPARQQREANASSVHDGGEHDRQWKEQTNVGMCESPSGQMRPGAGSASQPQDSQSQQHRAHAADSPPMTSRDASPVVAKSTTPHTTPPIPSPAYALTNPYPHTQHKTSESPTTTRQNVSHFSQQSVSPTNAHPSASYSPTTSHTVGNLPFCSAPSPTVYTPISPCMQPTPYAHSHASPGTPSTASYIPPLKPPSRLALMSTTALPVPPTCTTPPAPPQPHLQLPPGPPLSVLQLQPQPKPKTKDVGPNEGRSFEDELLSLVDEGDVKPKIHPATATPTQQIPPPNPFPLGRETTASLTPKTKLKTPLKSRVSAKSSKAKAVATAARHATGTSIPVPGSSMPPPSPSPQRTKQQPAVARTKGRTAGTSSSRKKGGATAARSRSLSVKPLEPTPAPVEEEAVAQQDDRLYCLCETPYEEDKIMIACDRCDEWYHPACVGMPEAEVDLVDQFICSSCSAQNPALHTTYKPRCHRGLNHIPAHDTLPTCWKPARGAFSKYCSEECGVAHMRAKIVQSGRSPAELWPAVKNARPREGVTISHPRVNVKTEDNKAGAMDIDTELEKNKSVDARVAVRKAMKEADEREMCELRRRLEDVMRAREVCKLALERVVMRRRLLDLAVERAGLRCGWDARLEMGDNEWAGWVDTEEGRRALNGADNDEEAEWWCQGPEACPRHRGWQTVRDLDVQLEVDKKNASIKQLIDRERELRRRIEDLDPPSAPRISRGKSGVRKKAGKRSTR